MRLIFPMSDDMMGVQKIFEERPTAKAKAGGSFLSDTEGAQWQCLVYRYVGVVLLLATGNANSHHNTTATGSGTVL